MYLHSNENKQTLGFPVVPEVYLREAGATSAACSGPRMSAHQYEPKKSRHNAVFNPHDGQHIIRLRRLMRPLIRPPNPLDLPKAQNLDPHTLPPSSNRLPLPILQRIHADNHFQHRNLRGDGKKVPDFVELGDDDGEFSVVDDVG